MYYNCSVSDIEKLHLLNRQMNLEPAEDLLSSPIRDPRIDTVRISRALLPDGSSIRLLKTLLSSYCDNRCAYCPFQRGRDFRRAKFTPDKFASLFAALYRAGIVEGIFLSSGIYQAAVHAQDQLLDTAEILRRDYHFPGYLHLKILPGAEREQVYRAMCVADRLSVNLEAPTRRTLQVLAPQKRFQRELIAPLRWMEEIRSQRPPHHAWQGCWPSSTTQFVVGPAGESDLELLSTTQFLEQEAGLSRTYFSRFTPVQDTPLEEQPPTPPTREHRLYQASFLLRDYGFDLEELPFVGKGNLPQDQDPKTVWAKTHLKHHPVEVNTAHPSRLLRVPGLGPVSVEKILNARRQKKLTSLSQLKALGIQSSRCGDYITLDGKRPLRQPRLF